MNRAAQHGANIKRYLAEGRTVSGGDGNGPGKPGYKLLAITTNWLADETALNALADQGYRVESANTLYILLANYPKKDA